MKGLIILDDIDNIDLLTAEVRLRFNGEIVGIYDDLKLKPMPEKKDTMEIALFEDIEYSSELMHEVEGYNTCIDEILGGTDND